MKLLLLVTSAQQFIYCSHPLISSPSTCCASELSIFLRTLQTAFSVTSSNLAGNLLPTFHTSLLPDWTKTDPTDGLDFTMDTCSPWNGMWTSSCWKWFFTPVCSCSCIYNVARLLFSYKYKADCISVWVFKVTTNNEVMIQYYLKYYIAPVI